MITEGEKGVGKIKSGVLQGSWAITADFGQKKYLSVNVFMTKHLISTVKTDIITSVWVDVFVVPHRVFIKVESQTKFLVSICGN